MFFIFLVSNIGGSLTPLGDPPLFLGFLKGVDFLWTLEAMLLPMLFVSGILLALFYVIDRLAWNRESAEVKGKSRSPRHIEIDGLHNVLYLLAIALAVLASGIWFRERDPPHRARTRNAGQRPVAGRRPRRHQPALLGTTTAKHPHRECVHLGADAGGGDPVRRHLHHA